ncbi:MAG: protein-tyrosine phosphatase family protein [Bacillota bacterium]
MAIGKKFLLKWQNDDRGTRRFLRKLSYYVLLTAAAFLMVLLISFGCDWRKKTTGITRNVHFVDSVGPNLLFRGALPQAGKPAVFDYKGLKKAITKAGEAAGITVPASFYLIDLNLLNVENPKDADLIYNEYKFFKKTPRLGRIQVWGITGTKLSPKDPALIGCRDYLARNLDNWLADRLATRVTALRRWLENPESFLGKNPKMPVVVYVHCVAGCDRTGEVIGAYYLRYKNKTWEEMNILNRSMCRNNRPFGCRNYRADQWYSLWLNLTQGYSLNWQTEFPCSGN